ncbi:MAG TPA: ATP-binding protein [Acidimicrobiales bacterium]|nr:ATP-binding protein [Acidimicrobiales bacterium]
MTAPEDSPQTTGAQTTGAQTTGAQEDGPDISGEQLLDLVTRALDCGGQGIVICGPDGTVVLRNAVARALVAAGEGDRLAEVAVGSALTRALRGESHVETLDLYSPTRHTLEIRSFLVQGPDGPIGAVAIVEDVSELKRLEAVRRDFVANLSHELKTPLGALSLLAETLDGEDDPEVVARLTGRLGTEARRFSRLVDDLLDLSRIEAGATGALVPVPLAGVLDEATEGFDDTAKARGIQLVVERAHHGLWVEANRRDLASAVANLVDNAIKYSEPGASVHVSAVRSDGRACIVVRDEGIGIPRRDQERIFERFYRVDRARSRWTGGTGLGLAIVRHVAAYHGGDVKLESSEGRGSTFTISLPAIEPIERDG